MIQRIQSIWLLLAAIATCLLFFFPVATCHSDTIWYDFYIYGLNTPPTGVEVLYKDFLKYVMIVTVLVTALTPLATIFLYKNRPRQIYLSRLAILLNVVLLIAFFVLSDSFATATGCPSFRYGYVALCMPVLSIVFLFLAMRGIKKDERLIRSADRIR